MTLLIFVWSFQQVLANFLNVTNSRRKTKQNIVLADVLARDRLQWHFTDNDDDAGSLPLEAQSQIKSNFYNNIEDTQKGILQLNL